MSIIQTQARLRLAAFSTFSQWGRNHSRCIVVDWPDPCTRAFADDNASIRAQVAGMLKERYRPKGAPEGLGS